MCHLEASSQPLLSPGSHHCLIASYASIAVACIDRPEVVSVSDGGGLTVRTFIIHLAVDSLHVSLCYDGIAAAASGQRVLLEPVVVGRRSDGGSHQLLSRTLPSLPCLFWSPTYGCSRLGSGRGGRGRDIDLSMTYVSRSSRDIYIYTAGCHHQ